MPKRKPSAPLHAVITFESWTDEFGTISGNHTEQHADGLTISHESDVAWKARVADRDRLVTDARRRAKTAKASSDAGVAGRRKQASNFDNGLRAAVRRLRRSEPDLNALDIGRRLLPDFERFMSAKASPERALAAAIRRRFPDLNPRKKNLR